MVFTAILTLPLLASCDDALSMFEPSKSYTLRAQKIPILEVSSRYKNSEGMPHSVDQERASLCDRELGPGQIRIWETIEPRVVTNNRSIAELTKEAPSYDHSANILGRTYGTLDAKIQLHDKFITKTYAGYTCMRPSIDVELKLTDFRVAVAKEFKPSTCAFKHILKHEYKHVAVNRATLRHAAETLSKELHDSFDHKIFFGPEPVAKSELNKLFATQWAPRIKDLLSEGTIKNAEIDSPEEYAGNRTACEGAIWRTVVKSRQLDTTSPL